ncbi:MAG: lamin tail domain-containing protein [Planctomycetes bacterium]|nr:lamin tail domain-containing protein [Planctomycetota bacterium]
MSYRWWQYARWSFRRGLLGNSQRRRAARSVRLEPLEPRLVLAAAPVISEFMAINEDALQDEDGDFTDWVEIHNPSRDAIDLDGWHLSDDQGDLSRWTFPATTLEAGEYLVVFASAKDRATAGSELHTNFKLDGSGEYLGLIEPDGVTVASQFSPQFPPQSKDVSYGLANQSVTTTLVVPGGRAKVRVPTGSIAGWNSETFDDAGWSNGTTGVGYERGEGYEDLIRTDVESQMYDTNGSVYVRIALRVSDPLSFSSLTLRMKYDDGFVAYLNGQQIAARNAPAPLAWNSQATDLHDDGLAVVFENFDVTVDLDKLRAGDNVLAIQGLNRGLTSSDMLVLPQLDAGQIVGTTVGFLDQVSPGGPNGGGFVDEVGDTKFSVDRGFFDTAFDVEITTETPGATIRYTTDGSEPSATRGSVYSSPFRVARTTVLRAVAVKAGFAPSNIDTQTYFFLSDVIGQSRSSAIAAGFPSGSVNSQSLDYGMDPDIVNSGTWGPQMIDALRAVPSISIVTDVSNLFSSSTGIYVNPRSRGEGWERPASVELINPDGSDGFQVNAGLRIRGGFSRTTSNPKHAFRLFFRDKYGASKLRFPLFGDEGVDRFDKIDLRTTQNYSWAFGGDGRNAFVRDVFSRDAMREINQPYTRSRYYHLYLNGQYWGLYQTEERADASFAESYFGGDKEDYDVIKSTGNAGGASNQGNYENEATDGNLDAYRRLWNEIRAGGLGGNAKYFRLQGLNADGSRNQSFERMIDVDNVIDYMIVTYFTGDKDGPGSRFTRPRVNNYFAIYNRNDPDGWKFFEHDSEHSLDTGESNMVTPLTTGGAEFRYFNPHWLHEKLTANAEYRQRFADHLSRHFFNEGILTAEKGIEQINARASEIETAIIAESARWGDAKRSSPFTKNDWTGAINSVRGFFSGRTGTVINQIRSQGWYPSIAAPSFNQNGGQIPDDFSLFMSAPTGTIYYMLDGSDPRMTGGAISPDALVFDGSTINTLLVGKGSTWRYLDDGSNQGTAWRARTFNDGAWASGPAQLGYGDGDERHVVASGPQGARFITTYFRRSFNVTNAAQFTALTLNLLRDDGAVVYLNGQEVGRSNMPTGGVNYQTTAQLVISGAEESTVFHPINISPSALREGNNVLAVEIHQQNSGSSDISFDAELVASISTGSTIRIDEATIVMARARSGSTWSPLHQETFFVDAPAAAGNLVIAEINYHPHDPTPAELAADPLVVNADFEFLELRNTSDVPIDLTGVSFVDGIALEIVLESGRSNRLLPGESVIVVGDRAAFQSRYDSGARIVGQFAGNLRNGGERLTLRDRFGEPIVNFRYDDRGAWPNRADGSGSSLELIDDAGDLEDGNNWRSSAEFGGSPGEVGTGPIASVVINEVLTHTDAPLVDAVELHNPTVVAIDVSGWYLSDSKNYQKFRIPAGTVIPAGGYRVFDETDFNRSAGVDETDFAFDSARGDDVWLLSADSTGRLTRFVDHIEFDAAANGESFGRWPNALGVMTPMLRRTLGGQNAPPRFGPLVISEIMYHPKLPAGSALDGNDLEYVEIHNPTGGVVDLTNWRLDKGVDYRFLDGTSLAAFGTLVVTSFNPDAAQNAEKLAAFREHYEIDVNVALVGGYSGSLDNGGERVQLQRPDLPPLDDPQFFPGLIEDAVRYDEAAPWPTGADGSGQSLTRRETTLWGNFASSWIAAAPTPGSVSFATSPHVVGRHVFYNNSFFDGNNPATGPADDGAIASDKSALLLGSKATFANVSSFVSGINGVMIDVAGLDDPGDIDLGHFEFRTGNTNHPANWPLADLPTLTVRPGAGVDNSDRYTLTWPDGTLINTWLRVALLATPSNGLAQSDVFFFGSAVGDTGTGNRSNVILVDGFDRAVVRVAQQFDGPVIIDSTHDFNRDGAVDAADRAIVRANPANFLTGLTLFTPSLAAPAPPNVQFAVAGPLRPADASPPRSVSRSETTRRGTVDELFARVGKERAADRSKKWSGSRRRSARHSAQWRSLDVAAVDLAMREPASRRFRAR